MTNKNVKNVIDGAEIPSIPHVLQQILALASDPSSSSKDLEKLVLKEPGLVTHLLKTVNSAYYGLGREITSINHAIVLLGYLAVKSIVSGLALIDAFNNIPGLNKEYVLQIWKQSLASAGLIKILAQKSPREKQDDLFLSAMVQNVGHMVLAQYFQSKYDELIDENHFPTADQEKECFNVDHTEIGAFLLESWKFPPKIAELVKFHHSPESFEGEQIDIQYIEVCNLLSYKNEGLLAFLEQSENDVDPELINKLKEVAWSWEDLQEEKERLIDSVDLAQQIVRG